MTRPRSTFASTLSATINPSATSFLRRTTLPPSPLTPPIPNGRIASTSSLDLLTLQSSRWMRSQTPQTPLPWLWRCHLCYTTYRLGTTRRCLNDGHTFCSVMSSRSSPKKPTSPPSAFLLPLSDPQPFHLVTKHDTKHKLEKPRRKTCTGCASEFDYAGWAVFNAWRREMALEELLSNESDLGHGEGEHPTGCLSLNADPELKWWRNCYQDCDFPSECLNTHLWGPKSSDIPPLTPELMVPISMPKAILGIVVEDVEAKAGDEDEVDMIVKVNHRKKASEDKGSALGMRHLV